jgi:hypothetical protein
MLQVLPEGWAVGISAFFFLFFLILFLVLPNNALTNPCMLQVLPEGWALGMSAEGREYYYMHTDAVPIALGLLQVQHYIPRVSAMFFFFTFVFFLLSPPLFGN